MSRRDLPCLVPQNLEWIIIIVTHMRYKWLLRHTLHTDEWTTIALGHRYMNLQGTYGNMSYINSL